MGYIVNSSGALPDVTEFTYASFIRINTDFSHLPGHQMRLLAFGNPDEDGRDSSISVLHNGSFGGYVVSATFSGKNFEYLGAVEGQWSSAGGGHVFPDDFDILCDVGEGGTLPTGAAYGPGGGIEVPVFSYTTIAGGTFAAGTLLAIFNSNLESYGVETRIWTVGGHTIPGTTPGTASTGVRALTNFRNPDTSPFGGPQMTIGVWHHVFISARFGTPMTDETPPIINNDGSATYTSQSNDFWIYIDLRNGINYNAHNFSSTDFNKAGATEFGLVDGHFELSEFIENPTDIDGALASGYPMYIPGLYPPTQFLAFEDDLFNKCMYNTMIWFNKYIEPTPANLAKFVNSKGRPVSASTAISAFGQPHFCGNGGKKAYIANKLGSLGEFININTARDFTPTP